ncbi:hypothetical protein BH11PSE2_BH11PSE2_02360 [soil metagenome]
MRKLLMFGMAAAIASGPQISLAQGDKAADKSKDTTVDELVVKPLVDTPNVGKGAPQYTVEDIQQVEKQAQRTVSDSNSWARQCAGGGGMLAFNHGGKVTIEMLLTDAFRRTEEAALKVRSTGVRSEAATLAATQVRLEAGRGEKTDAEVKAAELVRQAAVNAFVEARANLGRQDAVMSEALRVLQERGYNKTRYNPQTMTDTDKQDLANIQDELKSTIEGYEPPAYAGSLRPVAIPRQYSDLVVEKVVAREHAGGKVGSIIVTGQIRNTRAKAIPVPSLSFTAVDRFGYPLGDPKFADGRGAGHLAPGEAKAFSYELKPKPAKISTVVVTFAPATRASARPPISQFCNADTARANQNGM